MRAEKTEEGEVTITMNEQEARDLKELTGKMIRTEEGIYAIERDDEKRMRLYKTAYFVSGALFELF